MSIADLQSEILRLQDLLAQRQALVTEVETQIAALQKQLAAAHLRELVNALLPLLSEAQLADLDAYLRATYSNLIA